MGGVLGLRYARTSTVESVLFKSSHAMRFTNRGEGVGTGGVISCGRRLSFRLEGSSTSSFAGGTVVAEKNVTWGTNFMVFEFVM